MHFCQCKASVSVKARWLITCFGILTSPATPAQLMVTISPPRITANKIVVPVGIKNSFTERVEAARAVAFVMDTDGKVVNQSARWVIGGSANRPPLDSGATNAFYFVITNGKPLATTNITVNVAFTKVVLEGSKVADPKRDVILQQR